MNIYTRYISGEHDKEHFGNTKKVDGHIRLRPLLGHFDSSSEPSELKPIEYWKSILPNAAFFSGYDSVFFGHVLTMLYRNETTHKMCAISITKFGCNLYENMILDSNSRFWPACQNLAAEHRNSNVRKALAITNLKNFNKLWNNKGFMETKECWDETNAGSLASTMILSAVSPTEVGEKLLSLDFLQELAISALTIDVIYDNCSSDPKITSENNNMVTLLGSQMEQLFDPLLEYSPQALEYSYVPPATFSKSCARETQEVDKVIDELFRVQSNYTMDLVTLLQDFIIPLRVQVLNDLSDTTDGAIKINTVFPPTIDEVARINCILNNTLKVATGFGCSEIFKVLASILPFFYKAFARHQANISCFHARFEKFVKHNRSYAFDNMDINKHSYTPKLVENIVVGSLFQLLKLKLIIKRLYSLVISDESRKWNSECSDINALGEFDKNYRTIIETIDSLGCEDDESLKDNRKSRIFTPSGKLLTELATSWPAELQYGWMNRKILAIHELRNAIPDTDKHNENVILMIFSDHLLFIDIIHPADEETSLVVPDVLMHSLMNEKPLPTFANFPKLKVRYWCDVKQLIVKAYRSDHGHNLSFTTYGENHFHLKSGDDRCVSLCYSIKSTEDSVSACNNIVTQICKGQILRKSSPFHLFKYEDSGLSRFYCAHEVQNYHDEVAKSPLVILINMDKENALETLKTNPQILVVLTISFLNEHIIQITGYDRENTLKISDIVSTDNINISLRDAISQCWNLLFYSSELRSDIIEANSYKIKLLLNSLLPSSTNIESAVWEHLLKTDKENKDDFVTQSNAVQKDFLFTNMKEKKEKHNLVLRVFDKFKLRVAKQRKPIQTRENLESRLANIPQTTIPRGKKPAFKKLYKPDPLLREMSAATSILTKPDDLPALANAGTPNVVHLGYCVGSMQPRILSANTVLSSIYSALEDIVSDGETPIGSNLHVISEDFSVHSNAFERLGANIGSVRYVPKKAGTKNCSKENSLLKPVSAQLASESYSDNLKPKALGIISQLAPQRREQVSLSKQKEHIEKSGSKLKNIRYPAIGSQDAHAPKEIKKAAAEDKNSKLVISSLNESKVQKSDAITTDWVKEIIEENNAPSIISKRTRSLSQSTADALDNSHAHNLSHSVHSKYKKYEELPLSLLINDEELNWTSLAKDSYSNLYAEVQAMKNEVKERKASLHSLSNLTMMMKPNAQQYETYDDTFSSIEFVTYLPDNFSQQSFVEHPKLIYDVGHSLQSSTSDLAEIFGKQIDKDFSLQKSELASSFSETNTQELSTRFDILHLLEVQENPDEARNQCTEDLKKEVKMQSDNQLAPPDEECAYPSELSNALDFWNQEIAEDQETYFLTSASSEKTLMNELASPLNVKQSNVLPHKSHVTKWDGETRSLDLVDSYESIAYLPEILTGEIAI